MPSRTPSVTSAPARHRSNTTTSIQRPTMPLTPTMATSTPPTPARVGDRCTLTAWVHSLQESLDVVFNRGVWNAGAGSVLRVVPISEDTEAPDEERAFMFIVPEDDAPLPMKYGLQVSLPQTLADAFHVRNGDSLQVTKVDRKRFMTDYVELAFQDQYLGRNEMWRVVEQLEGKGKNTCLYVGQEVSFLGSVAARVTAIHVDGKRASSGLFGATTKTTFRSMSAKITIFIQVCRELWDFAGDGERYNEKVVHSFLPALFSRWKAAGTRHTVTIVLISRVFYDPSERAYAAGPLRQAAGGCSYKDFFKVVADAESIADWRSTLESLKQAFTEFQRDILLTHHYHRGEESGDAPASRLVGRLSYAHDGPILEAINLGLGSAERHFVDRALSITGASTILVTPGAGLYHVDKHLLRLTTTRVLDHGFGVDLVCLAPRPLHQAPMFSFQGSTPLARSSDPRAADPLWGGDERPEELADRVEHWWEPFWMAVSYWDRQMDLPFRQDRFIARAKMHKIQMLGLLGHDILSSIEIPYLKETDLMMSESSTSSGASIPPTKEEADKFDMDVFALPQPTRPAAASRNSYSSSTTGTVIASSYHVRRGEHRASVISTSSMRTIGPIEESPRYLHEELPPETPTQPRPLLLHADSQATVKLSTSPSQISIRTVASVRSSSTTSARRDDARPSATSGLLKPLWFLNPFKVTPAKAEAVTVTAHAATSPIDIPPSASMPIPSSSQQDSSTPRASPLSCSPQTTGVNRAPSRSSLSRTWEGDSSSVMTQRARTSPVSASPRDSASFGRRRSLLSQASTLISVAPPQAPTNPLRVQANLPPAQLALARRWQHFGPGPWFKHEMKWKSLVMPGCLPLSVESLPPTLELEHAYDVFSYESFVDPSEVSSFLVRPPQVVGGTSEDSRRAFAHAVMHGMASVRLAQGFQFVLREEKRGKKQQQALRRTESFSVAIPEDEAVTLPRGVATVSGRDTIYLSMSNEIHRISYIGDSIQVRRYVRKMPPLSKYKYECLIWPKLGVGYTEMQTAFDFRGLGDYGWNRLDMLVAGYEQQFNESLRYWRTRFVVIPTDIPPATNVVPHGERLDDEEIRMVGMDKLAEMFHNARWRSSDRAADLRPIRFLLTDLDPTSCLLDEDLMGQLDQVHASGPLGRKIQERYIDGLALSAIAKAMREEGGVPVKDYRWHGRKYPASFTGSDFVSWLCREFKDVPTREEGVKWGGKLQDLGLFDHSRGFHGFLDGYYYYTLKAEYALPPSTPKTGWFRSVSRQVSEEHPTVFASPRKSRKQHILSQSMVIDVDRNKRSDQAETVVLHHDIIHNPGTAFHFELHWIGTAARCIEDLIHRQWGWTIERYGLRLVEAYVGQIEDIQDRGRNPFQSCFPIRLAAAPPSIPDIPRRASEGATQFRYPFECAILRRFGFVLDIEASALYPTGVDVYYSYRASKFAHSQYVHRSGVAFVQLVGGPEGFLFLTNRLLFHGRPGAARKHEQLSVDAADALRQELNAFCADSAKLEELYTEEIDHLRKYAPPSRKGSEEPPDLSI